MTSKKALKQLVWFSRDYDGKIEQVEYLANKLEVLDMIIREFRDVKDIEEKTKLQLIMTFDEEETERIKELVANSWKEEDEDNEEL